MADFTLSNGKEITFDLNKLSHREWEILIDPKESRKKSDAIMARVFGVEVSELGDMPEVEYRQLVKALIQRVINPISKDPNA